MAYQSYQPSAASDPYSRFSGGGPQYRPNGNGPQYQPAAQNPTDPNSSLGGIYGVTQNLMSGARTPLEELGGYGWANQAFGGPSATDKANEAGYRSLATTASPGESGALSAYQGMIGKGYSPAEMNAMFQEGANAVLGQKASTLGGMNNLALRTGNTSGLFANAAKVGANAADQLGQFARQNQINQANETERRTEAGASGLANVGQMANTRTLGALGGSTNLASQLRNYQQAGLTGLGAYNQAGRANQALGLDTGVGMWNSSNAQQMAMYNLLAQLLKTPTGSTTTGGSTTVGGSAQPGNITTGLGGG